MRLIEHFIAAVSPFECLGCRHEGALLCTRCAPASCAVVPSRCYRCRAATTDYRVCKSCRSSSKLHHVWVRTELAGLPRQLLHRFKFERAQAACVTIAGFLEEVLPAQTRQTIIVPLPTATSRVRERGYDHARLLARELAHARQQTCVPALVRLNQTRQVGAGREERLTQLKGAFRVARSEQVRGAHILLVDDVLTTGSTLEEAAHTLRQAGAATVNAVVFAQR